MSRRLTAFVAGQLGLELGEAALLLAGMRDRVGRGAFAVRAAGFTVAVRGRALPEALRRRALVAFVRPLLETPLALNAFAGRRVPPRDPCAGLRRGG